MTSKEKQAKIRRVMKEYKSGILKSSSGEKVKSRFQAIAIALQQAGMSKKDKSDAYWDAYVIEIEKEEPEEEEEEEEEEDSLGKD
jgi:hypothetical protein